MFFVYDDTERPKGFSGGKILDPHKPYIKHLGNWFFLRHICMNGSIQDKFQATKEMIICERKLDYWYRKPGFDPNKVTAELSTLRKQWNFEYKRDNFDYMQRNWIRQKKWDK